MNNQLLRVLRIRSFFFLWMAEIFSQIAINMMNFILIVVVFELTGSNTAVSGVVLSFTIPAILFGLYAGVYVDRRDKKKILIASNIIRALLLVALGFFHGNIFLLYFLAVLITIVTQFFIPAESPIIPRLVSSKLLLSANALFGVGVYGSLLVAYALSGPLYLFFQQYIFFFLAFLFLVAAIFCWLIAVPTQKKKIDLLPDNKTGVSLKKEVKELFALLLRTKAVYQAMFLLVMSQVIILILATIGPGYARSVLGINVAEFPVVFVTPAALGMFLTSVIVGNFSRKTWRGIMTTVGVFLSGFGILLLPYGSKVASRGFVTILNSFLPSFLSVSTLHITIFIAFVFGIANALVFVPSNTLLQEKVADEFRGKVYGLLNALVGVSSLLPIILVGGFADLLGVSHVLTGIGVIVIIIGLFRISFTKRGRINA